jgi:hypothetical protein
MEILKGNVQEESRLSAEAEGDRVTFKPVQD